MKKPLSVTERVEIKAPLAKVWSLSKDYDSLDKWHPGFAKDEITEGTNNEIGAVRALTIKDGPTFTEELLTFDETAHSYSYSIIESPLPLENYVAKFVANPGKDGGTVVVWSADFVRKNPSDSPPADESDDAAVKLITGVFQSGLANLKKVAETQ
jgi:polyketide cyclase/dehydrase/lipid transport protein